MYPIDPRKKGAFISIFHLIQVDPMTNKEIMLADAGPSMIVAVHFQMVLNQLDADHFYLVRPKKWLVTEWLDRRTVSRN